MKHVTHPEPGMVYVCPECDTAQVLKYVAEYPEPYRCRACNATFTAPNERVSKRPKYAHLSLEDVGLSPFPE